MAQIWAWDVSAQTARRPLVFSSSPTRAYVPVAHRPKRLEIPSPSRVRKGHYELYRDYFHPIKPTYDAHTFRCRYQMLRKLIVMILHGVKAYDDYFTAKSNATGKLGFTSYQKYSASIRMLAYGLTVIVLMSTCE
jgi:hypothetical protein